MPTGSGRQAWVPCTCCTGKWCQLVSWLAHASHLLCRRQGRRTRCLQASAASGWPTLMLTYRVSRRSRAWRRRWCAADAVQRVRLCGQAHALGLAGKCMSAAACFPDGDLERSCHNLVPVREPHHARMQRRIGRGRCSGARAGGGGRARRARTHACAPAAACACALAAACARGGAVADAVDELRHHSLARASAAAGAWQRRPRGPAAAAAPHGRKVCRCCPSVCCTPFLCSGLSLVQRALVCAGCASC